MKGGIMTKTIKKNSLYKWLVVGLLIFIAGLLIIVIATPSGEQASSDIETTTPIETYKFSYLAADCKKGVENYKALLPQYQAEVQRIKSGMNTANANYDTIAFYDLKAQATDTQKSMSITTERIAKLEACVTSVEQKLDFTPTELADIKSYISESTSMPTPKN